MFEPELPDAPQSPLSGRATAAGDPATGAPPVASGPGAAGAPPTAGQGPPVTAGNETGGLRAETLLAAAHCEALHSDPPLGLRPCGPCLIWAGPVLDSILAARAAQPDANTALDEVERRPRVSERRTDWGVRDDATGNVGTVGAYNRRAAEAWLAELSAPSTLMRRERTIYADDVTDWQPAALTSPEDQP